jgi:hypothetical protein
LNQDEVLGLTFAPVGVLPAPVVALYQIADEVTVHQSLQPNPDAIEDEDDDVDSLDIGATDMVICAQWYFTADHEATGISPFGMPLDPGDIYEVIPGLGPVLVIDDVNNLGVPDDTDVDAFEFAIGLDATGAPILTVLFSVDEDDPLTPGDESGGLDPRMIYVSDLMGMMSPPVPGLLKPLWDDVDGLTVWRDTLQTNPTICLGDLDCDGSVTFADINPFVLRLTNPPGYFAAYPTCPNQNGDMSCDGRVDFADINPFVSLLTAPGGPPPCPILCPYP